jgi:RNA polymerase sigma-70 factor (ECF subfamily)
MAIDGVRFFTPAHQIEDTGVRMSSDPARDREKRSVEDAQAAAAMQGDGEAIAAVWSAHRRWIAAVILAHKPVFEDLDDLLQEVAMTLVAKIDTVREHTNLRAWLRSVAINTARASARSGQYRPLPYGDGFDGRPDDRTADSLLMRSDDVSELLRRLERLPETYREPLLLRAVNGMRSKQIAELLGVPPAAIDTRVARARRMLRESEGDADRTVDVPARGADSSALTPEALRTASRRGQP